jgi:hypothetical protein
MNLLMPVIYMQHQSLLLKELICCLLRIYFSCFDLFEEFLETKYRDERKDFTHNDIPGYTVTIIRERSGINEFFTIEQTYFHWSDKDDDYVKDSGIVEKNPYLSNINGQLGGWVLAKVKPINFDI